MTTYCKLFYFVKCEYIVLRIIYNVAGMSFKYTGILSAVPQFLLANGEVNILFAVPDESYDLAESSPNVLKSDESTNKNGIVSIVLDCSDFVIKSL